MLTGALDHSQRLGKITASSMAAILGINPWKGAIDAWMDITGRATRDPSPRTTWGHYQERSLLAWYSDLTGRVLGYFGTIDHPALPILAATPDAVVFGERGLVECKNVGVRLAEDWRDGPPAYVLAQVQTQAEVCGADWVDVVASIGGDPPELWRVERDRAIGEAIVETAAAFHADYVLTDIIPPADDATRAENIALLYPHVIRDRLDEAEPDVDEAALRYLEARAVESAAKATKEAAKAAICLAIGDRAGLVGPTWRATWRDNGDGDGRRFDIRLTTKARKEGRKAA